MDEFGFGVPGASLLAKGTEIQVSNPTVQAVTGVGTPILMRVTSTWIQPDRSSYGATLEFSDANSAVLTAVRKWLASRTGAGPNPDTPEAPSTD